jgi:hypothetical protein
MDTDTIYFIFIYLYIPILYIYIYILIHTKVLLGEIRHAQRLTKREGICIAYCSTHDMDFISTTTTHIGSDIGDMTMAMRRWHYFNFAAHIAAS